MGGPLEGLHVLELASGVSGPYAGRLLTSLGATVLKVEPEGGDPSRRLSVDDFPVVQPGPLFVHLNIGKRNVSAGALDMSAALAWADVVIDDRVVADLAGTPLAPETLDGVVLGTTTAWGAGADDAGRPEDELLVQAASGLMTADAEPERAPLRFPGWQSQYLAGGYLAAGLLAALGRGEGRHVEVSWVDAMITGVEAGVCSTLYEASAQSRGERQAGFQAGAFPAGAFRCADGHVVPGTVRPIDWKLQCEIYDRPDLFVDERFDWAGRSRNKAALLDEIQPWYEAHPKREIFLAALEAGWAAGMVMTAADLVEDPHVAERGFLAVVEGSDVVVPGRPWRAPDLADGGTVRLAEAGEDDEWFRREVAASAPRTARPRHCDPRRLRIVELTWAWAGPFVGRFAGALGADVLHVETGRFPDGWRTRMRWKRTGADLPEGQDPEEYTWDAAALFNSLNRNKRSVSIDLATDEGRRVFLELVAQADALVVNMTYRVLADRGVEADVLRMVDQQNLVVLTMPALGATGPYRAMPGYGILMEGMGGFAARYGFTDEGARTTSTYYPDAVAGLHGSVALLAALASGRGAVIDLSQQETMWLQLGEGVVLRSRDGRDPERVGNAEPGSAPSGIYASLDGGWLALAVADDSSYDALVAVAAPHLDGFSGLDASARITGRAELDGAIARWASTVAVDEAVAILTAAGVGARRVLDYRRAPLAPRMLEELNHPVAGRRPYLAIPVVIEGERLSTRRAAPRFGAHTDEVLSEWLGLEDDRLRALRDAAAIGTLPEQPTPR